MSQLASRPNLKLAWRRITTGGNNQYKRFYRDLYYAYEVALETNLWDLRKRLLGGAFQPCHPERLYVPKASGLHRPLALLNIEGQIVLQAFANLAAKRMQPRRSPLQLKVVFSNVIQKPDSIFFGSSGFVVGGGGPMRSGLAAAPAECRRPELDFVPTRTALGELARCVYPLSLV